MLGLSGLFSCLGQFCGIGLRLQIGEKSSITHGERTGPKYVASRWSGPFSGYMSNVMKDSLPDFGRYYGISGRPDSLLLLAYYYRTKKNRNPVNTGHFLLDTICMRKLLWETPFASKITLWEEAKGR